LIQGIFDLADRDGNGELTEKELIDFLDLHAKGSTACLTLSMSDDGRALFEQLDTNGDNQLSPLELRTSWKLLEKWDANKDGCISPEEVPYHFELVFTPGRSSPFSRFGFFNPRGSNAKKGQDLPLWFRKMDHNEDGVVSRREFLGSDEDFQRLDTNGDGLIDAKEARAADQWFRKNIARGK